MGWATSYIEMLKRGETLEFQPRGNSMMPRIKSGQMVTVAPVDRDVQLAVGDVVLCRVHGREYLHFIKAIKSDGKQYVIGNAHGFINGTISRGQIFGRLV